MKKIVTINEEALKRIIEQVLTEKFENHELYSMIQQHNGLTKHGFLDMRNSQNTTHDLRTAKPKGYIPQDIVEKLAGLFDWNEPLRNQILWCNDGGLIVIDTHNFENDIPFMDKIQSRNNKFSQDNNEYANFKRKQAHEEK